MNDILQAMLEQALAVQQHSYSPYSEFKVGACIRTQDNQLFAGCNIENASYGLALCAESAAISAMISTGKTKIAEIVVVGMNDELCTPCGACRQRISEFSTVDTLVHMCDSKGLLKTMTIAELLPESFGPKNLA